MEDLDQDSLATESLFAEEPELDELDDADTAVEMRLLLDRVQAARFCGA